MNDINKYKTLMPHIIIQIIGFAIALSTGNIGNLLIFLGLYFVTSSSIFSRVSLSNGVKNIGRVFYVIGFFWSLFQPLALLLGWGSVFLTLLIGTFDFSKKLK